MQQLMLICDPIKKKIEYLKNRNQKSSGRKTFKQAADAIVRGMHRINERKFKKKKLLNTSNDCERSS